MPRFAYLLYASEESYASPPTREMFESMMAYNTALSDAGLFLSGDGLRSSNEGVRISFSDPVTVQSGPFNLQGLISGFWIVKAKSLDEAIEWAKKAPLHGGATLEVRQLGEVEDFGDAFTDELKKKRDEILSKAELRAKEG